MKKNLLLVLALVVVLSTGLAAQPAQALTVTGLTIEFGCTGMYIPNPYTLDYNRDNTGAVRERYSIVVSDGQGNVLYTEDGNADIHIDTVTGDFFVWYNAAPQYNPITFTWVSVAGNGLEEHVVLRVSGACDGLPWVTDPTYPEGYVQRTIICDVQVFDRPAGQTIGDNMLKAGQDWHVNPTPVEGPDGQLWTEVFVGGYELPYVPTACVSP